MAPLALLTDLAVRPLLKGIAEALSIPTSERVTEAVTGFLVARFTDPSRKLTAALHQATHQAWRALEVALAGESLTSWLDRGENKAFRAEVRAFLSAAAADLPDGGAEARAECLRELRAARKAGAVPGTLQGSALARQAADFLRFSDPGQLIEAEWQAVGRVAAGLHGAGYPSLGRLLQQRPARQGPPLLAVAVRFFFRREIETDRELFQGLVYEQLDQLSQGMEAGLSGLRVTLERYGQELTVALESVEVVVRQTHEAVLDVQAELGRQGRQHDELYQAVLGLQQRLDLAGREVRPRDSFSIRSDAERQLVKQVVARYRGLPPGQRQELPALLNAVGKLEVAAGDFAAAEKDFTAVAALVEDRAARGEAHFNAYQALLEQGRYDGALAELCQALAFDAGRFAPFPLDRYEPVRIVGAGGFGVTFHCKYRPTGGDAAVKVLLVDGLERDVQTVFQEAGVLDQLNHPAIIQLRECGFADPERTRPYLVMSYFDGETLEGYVRRSGPVPWKEFLGMARPVAEALQAAHGKGILHRDVKPANLLVRREGAGWQVKVIDFGLALKESVLASARTTSRPELTASGRSIAGTLDYAAPEQMGKQPGARVGPPADVYGFGKTCCFALFQTPAPLRSHWRQVPEPLAELLEGCLFESPQARLADFGEVLTRLGRVKAQPPPLPPTPPPPPPPKALAPVTVAREVHATVVPVRRPPPRTEPARRRYEREDDFERRPRPRPRPAELPGCASALLGAVVLSLALAAIAWVNPIDRTSGHFIAAGVIGALMGGVGGGVLRSLWGWLFVLVCGVGGLVYGFATPHGLQERLVFMNAGLILGWIAGMPIKFVVDNMRGR